MGNSQSEHDKKEGEFEERLYEIVHQIYPESTEHITGMLLELEYDELERLLTTTNRQELLSKIYQAAENVLPER